MIEQIMEDLSDSTGARVKAQREENQRFWTYLMHLETQNINGQYI